MENILQLEKYEVRNELEEQDDRDLFESFINDYSDNDYIGDLISTVADSFVGINTAEILSITKDLYFSGAYEEASASGLLEGTDDLIKHLQMAWCEYNTSVLYENLDTLKYNYAMVYILENDLIKDLEDKELDEIEGIIEDIEHIVSEIDVDNQLRDIQNEINFYIEELQE